jgi:putative heme iron utilization protein
MDWVTGNDYAAARPDPLADAAEGILEHMNRDHADALLALVRAHADAAAEETTMLSVDRLGFRVRVRTGERLHAARISFPLEVTTAEECRSTLIEMVRGARG